MKRNFIYKIISLTNTICKSYLPLLLFVKLLNSMATYITSCYIPIVISFLEKSKYEFAVILCIVFPLVVWLIKSLAKYLTIALSTKRMTINQTISIEFYKSISRIPYSELESPKAYEQISLVNKSINRNGMDTIVNSILEILSTILVISGAIYIVSALPIWILLTMLCFVTISVLLEKKRADFDYGTLVEKIHTDIPYYYVKDELTEKEYAKDIRLYSMADLLSTKAFRSATETFSLLNKNKAIEVKYAYPSVIFNAIKDILVYGYLIAQCIGSKFTISQFTLISSSIFLLNSSIKMLFNNVLRMREEGLYVKDYFSYVEMYSEKSVDTIQTEPYKEAKIEFKNVSFKYPNSDLYALYNVNLCINPGEKISVVGPNGSGKTTLIKLLLRFYQPTSGEICINGVNINTIPITQYYSLFAPVFQDFTVYQFSIQENICFSNDKSNSNWNNALEIVGLSKKVDSLPNKAKTYIGNVMDDYGIDLSGGEKQLLAMARAINKNALIYILDEPTANLSPQKEYEYYCLIRDTIKHKSIVFISHRMASCRLCDRIIVLDKGKCIEYGTHEELMQSNGLYAQMFQKQLEVFE